MVHICFAGYGISSPWNEGKRVVSRNMIDALKKYTDLDISVVSSIGKKEEKMRGVEYANTTWLTRYTRYCDPLRDAAMIRLINSIDKRKNIDIIHLLNAHFPVFSLYGKTKRKKVIAQFFGNPHFNILKRLRVPRAIDMYITTSAEIGWLDDLGVKNFQRINPPINTDLFKPMDKQKARKLLNLPEDKFIVLYMGNLEEVRFSLSFTEEVKFLREQNNLLLIHANLVDTDWLKKSNILHKKNVILKREILREEQKSYVYNAADAFILPFSKKMNAYKHVFVIDPPITMLEAMSCGVPVIAPDVFSIPEIIKDGYNGYITPLGDFKKVDTILHYVSKEGDEEDSINTNARKTILNDFSYEKTAMRMKKIYEGVLNG